MNALCNLEDKSSNDHLLDNCSRRFVSNDELFDDLVSRAVKTEGHRWAIGGNAPVMAKRFALEGAEVLLSAKISEDMRRDLHESIAVAESSVVDKDDIHLILVGFPFLSSIHRLM